MFSLSEIVVSMSGDEGRIGEEGGELGVLVLLGEYAGLVGE